MVNRLAKTVWLALGVIGAVWALTTIATIVEGGPLDPPGPVGSTMQTLDDLAPSWHKSISGSSRFVYSSAEGTVLDRETGLVWDAAPSTSEFEWEDAVYHCLERTVAGEVGSSNGWRLPSAYEMLTLREPSVPSGAKLPSGHPFAGVSSPTDRYWTSTSSSILSGNRYWWELDESFAPGASAATGLRRAWCVRAPGGEDVAPTS